MRSAGTRFWSFAGLFLYVRIVFTAASSDKWQCICVMLVEFSPEQVHSPTEMDGNKKEERREDRRDRLFWRTELECSLMFDRWYLLVGTAHSVPQQSQKTSLVPLEGKWSKSKWDFVCICLTLRWCKGETLRLLNAVLCLELIPTNACFIFGLIWQAYPCWYPTCFNCIYFPIYVTLIHLVGLSISASSWGYIVFLPFAYVPTVFE